MTLTIVVVNTGYAYKIKANPYMGYLQLQEKDYDYDSEPVKYIINYMIYMFNI